MVRSFKLLLVTKLCLVTLRVCRRHTEEAFLSLFTSAEIALREAFPSGSLVTRISLNEEMSGVRDNVPQPSAQERNLPTLRT